VSTIKVDTYLTRGGASEIAIDKLKGASSAGSMTVVGEGGSTTTNLQQGLCKSWWFVTGTGTAAITDSLNTSGITDNGTGDYTVAISNDMANATYSMGGMCGIASSTDVTSRNVQPFGGAIAAGSLRYNTTSNDANTDQDLDTINYVQIFGDLA
jgi:hypothetical protein